MKRSEIPVWNGEVTKLWSQVSEVKRLVRIHNYLQRMELAGEFDHATPFEAAHELLFAPGSLRYVWQTTGRSTPSGFDMTRRTPSTETPSNVELREAIERERRERGMR